MISNVKYRLLTVTTLSKKEIHAIDTIFENFLLTKGLEFYLRRYEIQGNVRAVWLNSEVTQDVIEIIYKPRREVSSCTLRTQLNISKTIPVSTAGYERRASRINSYVHVT
jgi:4-diphosphocytidyl-2C-methyl-D-erythritol kinase